MRRVTRSKLSENKLFQHSSILVDEICEYLSWEGIDRLVDLTVGGGGHLEALLRRFPRPREIIAFDQDPAALAAAQKRLKDFEPIRWVHSNFRHLSKHIEGPVDRLVVDLGVSSHQLDSADRGFSFQKEGPLDMRMNPTDGEPVWKWLMRCGEEELAQILWVYGEERASRRLARRWVERRHPGIQTTTGFVEALGFELGSKDRTGRHPLTRVFQALRIHINQEVQALEELLDQIPLKLQKSGRAAILTFHSLEDREVKWRLRGKLKALNKKVIIAKEGELKANPRARSAKLRCFEAVENDSGDQIISV